MGTDVPRRDGEPGAEARAPGLVRTAVYPRDSAELGPTPRRNADIEVLKLRTGSARRWKLLPSTTVRLRRRVDAALPPAGPTNLEVFYDLEIARQETGVCEVAIEGTGVSTGGSPTEETLPVGSVSCLQVVGQQDCMPLHEIRRSPGEAFEP